MPQRITFIASPVLAKKIQAEAKATGLCISEIVRAAVSAKLNK